MPGLCDGSDRLNAFEWDRSQHPLGQRVSGRVSGLPWENLVDWWELPLLGGGAYTFQTRAATTFDSILKLYDDTGSLITTDNDSGDDGGGTSKVTYTPSGDEVVYLTVENQSWGVPGTYTLESDPAPDLYWQEAQSASRFDQRIPVVQSASRFGIRYAPAWTLLSPARLDADALEAIWTLTAAARLDFDGLEAAWTLDASSRFDAREGGAAGTWEILGALGRHDVRFRPFQLTGSRFAALEHQVAWSASRLTIQEVRRAWAPGRLEIHRGRAWTTLGAGGRMHVLVRRGWAIWARELATEAETRLGWIDAGGASTVLSDLALADGHYEIEVRPAAFFWEEIRGRRVTTVEITGGSARAGLPGIQDLAAEIAGGITTISWRVPEESADKFYFGIWYSGTSPVDTSGEPDQLAAYYRGVGSYSVTRAQVGSEYVAVAAVSDEGDQGIVTELALPWSAAVPASPGNQMALREKP